MMPVRNPKISLKSHACYGKAGEMLDPKHALAAGRKGKALSALTSQRSKEFKRYPWYQKSFLT
jgi:hypothetical protein